MPHLPRPPLAWLLLGFLLLLGFASFARAAAPVFDPVAETEKLLNTLPAEARAKSDAYFEGGYWLQLWNLVLTLVLADEAFVEIHREIERPHQHREYDEKKPALGKAPGGLPQPPGPVVGPAGWKPSLRRPPPPTCPPLLIAPSGPGCDWKWRTRLVR